MIRRTCRSIFVGSHKSSASSGATSSPWLVAMARLRAAATPRFAWITIRTRESRVAHADHFDVSVCLSERRLERVADGGFPIAHRDDDRDKWLVVNHSRYFSRQRRRTRTALMRRGRQERRSSSGTSLVYSRRPGGSWTAPHP